MQYLYPAITLHVTAIATEYDTTGPLSPSLSFENKLSIWNSLERTVLSYYFALTCCDWYLVLFFCICSFCYISSPAIDKTEQ